jgi:uncharacterized protein YecE (DUF72 family)
MPPGMDIMADYFIGTSGWHYDDWRGRFYPEKLPKAKWLEFYSNHFNTLELNNSFLHLPSENAFNNWYNSSPPGFVFAVKASRFITHIKRLKDCEEAIGNFMSRARLLQEKLGPLLYQLPPGLRRDDALLEGFLAELPSDLKHVIEFRHPSWFDEGVYKILRRFHTGFCIFDMPGLTSPLLATTGFAYVRFHGREGLYSSRYTDGEMADWAKKIKGLAKKLETVYIYFNNDVSGYALDNAAMIREHLEKSNIKS